jgi:hypothetical protein
MGIEALQWVARCSHRLVDIDDRNPKPAERAEHREAVLRHARAAVIVHVGHEDDIQLAPPCGDASIGHCDHSRENSNEIFIIPQRGNILPEEAADQWEVFVELRRPFRLQVIALLELYERCAPGPASPKGINLRLPIYEILREIVLEVLKEKRAA